MTAGQPTTEHNSSTARAALVAQGAGVASRREAAALALLLGVGVLLWALAYQVPHAARLAIGGDTETHRREDDAPFLSGFHASEPDDGTTWQWWTLEPAYGYRWTQEQSTVRLPGMGGGPWIVALHVNSGRPAGESVPSTWQVGQTTLSDLSIAASGRVYRLLTHADAAGSLRLHLETPTYASPTDPRPLGFVLRDVRATPAATLLRPPAWGTLGWLAAALGLFYGLGRWLVLPRRPALLLGLAGALLLALLLALHRPTLALMAPTLAGLALGCWALALAGRLALASARPALAHRSQTGALLALVLLAFALRAGGMLYPHARFSDHLLHANNVLEVGLGNVYFTEGLPDTRGGGDAPYPPGLYLLLAPALTLFPADMESRALLVQLGVALLDSLVVALLWLLLWRAGLGQRTALLGAALYLLPLPMLLSFARGEYANLGGQVLALPVLALLALGGSRSGAGGRGVLLLALLASIGLLSHMGVAISLALVLGAAWLLSVAGWLRQRSSGEALPLGPGVLTAGGAAAAAFAALCYYSAPQFVVLFAARLASDSAPPPAEPAPPLLAELGGIVTGLFAPWSELLPLLVGLGLAGALLLWVAPQRPSYPLQRASLRALLLAWWLGILLSFGLLLVARQGVRWEHFLLPVLCLGGGVALAALWRRGQAGRIVALGSLLAVLAHALTRWLPFVYDYLH